MAHAGKIPSHRKSGGPRQGRIDRALLLGSANQTSSSGVRSRATTDGLLVGRADELEVIRGLIEDRVPLITLTGPPGVGKTRLAREIAASQCHRGGVEVTFCDLRSATSAAEVASIVSRERGVPTQHNEQFSSISGEDLLVLDNLEQLDAGALQMLGTWLEASRDLMVLATSRKRLQLPNEVCLDIQPLTLEHGTELLRHHARSGGYALRESRGLNADVDALVEHLDRLPLAIELAAARLGVLSPRDLLDRLDGGSEAAWQPLRAAAEWSWDLLSTQEQETLATCSVFRGGFTAAAAEAIVEGAHGSDTPVVEVLQSLRTKSLMHSAPQTAPDAPLRLDLYESIRDLGLRKLAAMGMRARVEEAHTNYFLDLVQAREASPGTHLSEPMKHRVQRDVANLLSIYHRSLSSDPDVAAMVALALHRPLLFGGTLHLTLVDRALDALGAEGTAVLRARLLAARAHSNTLVGRRGDAERDMNEARHLALSLGDHGLVATVSRLWGTTLWTRGDRPGAIEMWRRAAELAAASGSRWEELITTGKLAVAAGLEGRPDEAVELHERAISGLHELGDLECAGMELNNLGYLLVCEGRLTEAETAFKRGLALVPDTSLGNLSPLLDNYGTVLHARGELSGASAPLHAALDAGRRCGIGPYVTTALSSLCLLELELGNLDTASTLAEEAGAVAQDLGDPHLRAKSWMRIAAVRALQGDVARAREALKVGRSVLSLDALPDGHPLRLFEIFEHVARGRDALREGEQRLASEHQVSVLDRCASARERRQDAVGLIVLRLLEGAVAEPGPSPTSEPAAPGTLRVAADGSWFQVGGNEKVSMAKHPVLRRILSRLATQQLGSTEPAVPLEELIGAAWPGDASRYDALANRAWVAVSALRKLGLRGILIKRRSGYVLAPTGSCEVL